VSNSRLLIFLYLLMLCRLLGLRAQLALVQEAE
jgi:hypothetical protein